MPKLSNRLDWFSESIIRKMTRIANKAAQEGKVWSREKSYRTPHAKTN